MQLGRHMRNEGYPAEELWLHAHFEEIDAIDLDLEVEKQMRHESVSLSELLTVLKTGAVISADREHEGCHFVMKGRTCDDEEVTAWGVFQSETRWVSIMKIQKAV